MDAKLFLSHSLDALADQLIEGLDQSSIDPLETQVILVPNGALREWLLLKIAKKRGIAMGLKLLEIEQVLKPTGINSLQMFCLVFASLSESKDPALAAYLQGKKKRLLDLTAQLSSLFFQYGQFDASLFKKKSMGWQGELLQKLFVDGPWRLPVQQEVYHNRPTTWNLDRAKAPGIVDRKLLADCGISMETEEPSCSAISSGQVLTHLIWSTITQVDDRKDRAHIRKILDFFKEIPSYQLILCADVERNAKFLKKFILAQK